MIRLCRTLALALIFLAVPASAQFPPQPPEPPESPNISVERIDLHPLPTVSVPGRATAWVANPSEFTLSVTVRFSFADGTSLTGDPGGLGSSLTRTVPPGERTPFNITFTPPQERRGDAKIVAVAETSGDPDTSNNRLEASTFVRDPALNLTFEEPTNRTVLPGGTTFLRFFVRNDGNANDTPYVATHTQPPWIATQIGVLPEIAPGESATGFLRIRVEQDSARNLSLEAEAISSLREATVATAHAPELHVNESALLFRHSVDIAGLAEEIQVFPGENVTHEVRLINVGAADDVFNVTVNASGPGWRARISVPPDIRKNESRDNSTPLAVPLRSGEERILHVNVSYSGSMASDRGTLFVNTTSANEHILRNATLDRGYNRSATASLLPAAPDATLRAIRAPALIYRGDTAEFRFDVANAGRRNATNLTLHAEILNNLEPVRVIDLPVPDLAPAAATHVTWSPSTSDLAGAYIVTARVAIANATSVDSTPMNDASTLTIHVRSPVLGLMAPDSVKVVPGSRLLLASSTGGLSVENRGDSTEIVDVNLVGDAPWLNISWRLEVPPGAASALDLSLDVPRTQLVPTLQGELRASVAGRSGFSASTRLVFEVSDIEAPEVRLVSPIGPILAGAPTRLGIEALDALGVARADALVRMPNGEHALFTLEPNATAPSIFEVGWTPGAAGNYSVEFRVTDASESRHYVVVAKTIAVQEAPYGGFELANVVDGSLGSRELRLREVDPGSTRSLLVDHGEGLMPVRPPYEIRVSTWKEGPNALRLKATSIHGSSWDLFLNVTLDMTPPDLEGPRLEDAGGGRLRLSVTATDADALIARFETSEGPIDVDLPKQGNGLFSSTIVPPSDWSKVVFIGRDVVGNERSTAVVAQDNDTPMASLGSLLAITAATAAIISRRRLT